MDSTPKDILWPMSKPKPKPESISESHTELYPELFNEEPLYRPADFKSFRIKIALKNVTTETEIVDGRRVLGYRFANETTEPNLTIRLLQILMDGVILEIPQRTCQVGHSLVIEFETIDSDPLLVFSTSVKVRQLSPAGKGVDKVDCKLVQYDPDEWQNFCSIFENRQMEINNFLDSSRG